MLFTAAASVYNFGQAYFADWQSREVYAGKAEQSESRSAPPWRLGGSVRPRMRMGLMAVTPLASRLFGTWTLLAAAIRFKAAYDITNPA